MRWIRRLIVFVLGIILIVDSLTSNFHVLEFIVGLIMTGLIPIDTIVDIAMSPHNDEEQIKRLREVYNPPNKKNLSTGVDNSENSPKE